MSAALCENRAMNILNLVSFVQVVVDDTYYFEVFNLSLNMYLLKFKKFSEFEHK